MTPKNELHRRLSTHIGRSPYHITMAAMPLCGRWLIRDRAWITTGGSSFTPPIGQFLWCSSIYKEMER